MYYIKVIGKYLLLLLFIGKYVSAFPQNKVVINKKNISTAHIKVFIPNIKAGDSLHFSVYDPCCIESTDYVFQHKDFAVVADREGYFKLPFFKVNHPCYFSLSKGNNINGSQKYVDILSLYLVEPGDDVFITGLENKAHQIISVQFSGVGSEKYNARRIIDTQLSLIWSIKPSLKILGHYKKYISWQASQLLKCELIAQERENKLREITANHFTTIDKNNAYKDSVYKILIKDKDLFSEKIIAYSKSYPYYIVDRIIRTNKLKYNDVISTSRAYAFIKNKYSGELRDKLLTILIYSFNNNATDSIKYNAIQTIKTHYYKNIVIEVYNNLKEGAPAYNFSLPNVNGQIVKLSDFTGKVVLMDFWFTGCGGCRAYYHEILSKVEKKFSQNSNVAFISISIDTKKQVWLNSINAITDSHDIGIDSLDATEYLYTSPNIINLYTNGNGNLDPVIINNKVLSYPRPILIDKNGKIFSSKDVDLRENGVVGLTMMINKALNAN